MGFTDAEKARVKHFLSYPDWVSMAQSIQLGYPAASQPAFLVDDAFHRLTPHAENSVRINLQECECIERELSGARSRFRAKRMGELELNDQEPKMLRHELLWWTTRLADDLGVLPDPYSQMIFTQLNNSGGIGARVG